LDVRIETWLWTFTLPYELCTKSHVIVDELFLPALYKVLKRLLVQSWLAPRFDGLEQLRGLLIVRIKRKVLLKLPFRTRFSAITDASISRRSFSTSLPVGKT
jgi:hypothetical protein